EVREPGEREVRRVHAEHAVSLEVHARDVLEDSLVLRRMAEAKETVLGCELQQVTCDVVAVPVVQLLHRDPEHGLATSHYCSPETVLVAPPPVQRTITVLLHIRSATLCKGYIALTIYNGMSCGAANSVLRLRQF